MITTVIPFLLVANLSDSLDWSHGPEFVFEYEVSVEIKNVDKDIDLNGLDVTSHIRCSPNGENILNCGIDHDYKPGSRSERPKTRFEMKFDRNGVESITLRSTSNRGFVPLIYKSMAKLFNTGVDLRSLKYENIPNEDESQQMVNLLLGKCMSNIHAKYLDSSSSNHNTSVEELDLMKPLKSITSEKHFTLDKLTNTSDCEHYTHFYWAGIPVGGLHEDPTLKIISYIDSMQIFKESFISENMIHMERLVKDEKIVITEKVTNSLIDIFPAQDAVPAVEDPVTISM